MFIFIFILFSDVGIGVLTIFERRCAARKNNEFTKVDLLAKGRLIYINKFE